MASPHRDAAAPITAARAPALTPPLGLGTHAAALALAVLFASGAFLAGLSVVLPGGAGVDEGLIIWLAVVAAAVAGLLAALNRHLPIWSHQAFVGVGSVLIGVASWAAQTPPASVTFALFFVWVALYACLFFPWLPALLHLAFVGIVSALALVTGDDPLWASWVITFGTVAVSGIIVGWLVRRAESYYLLLYEGERAVVRELEAVEQVKTDLVAVVSHELRTPLTSIRGLVRTLQVHGHRLSDEERGAFLSDVDRESARLSRLVQNLLIASRASSADHLASARVSSIVRRAIEDMQQAGRSVEMRLEADERDVTARIAPDALAQVMLNLLDNATKFAVDGSGVVVRITDVDGHVHIAVINEADPLTPTERSRMFDPFVQLSPSLEARSEGIGLGLYVVRRLVEEHGGEVSVASHGGRLHLTVLLPKGADG